MAPENKRIILSRSDSLGDVTLTLPMAGLLKERYPGCEIFFLGKEYTRELIGYCSAIDDFISIDDYRAPVITEAAEKLARLKAGVIVHVFPEKYIAELASRAGIPLRIGTTGRWYHYLYCNRLVPLSRRRSKLHEAQLNLKLLAPLGIRDNITSATVGSLYGLQPVPPPEEQLLQLLDKERFNLILHPKSMGSAREWGLHNFRRLVTLLSQERFKVFVTGLQSERVLLEQEGFFEGLDVTDLCGQLSLGALIRFIGYADGLVAASTGPLHIAAATGIHAIGIYPPITPMHAGRWGPLGANGKAFYHDIVCNACRKGGRCECMEKVSPETIAAYLNSLDPIKRNA
jgi:heptosyltransferase III